MQRRFRFIPKNENEIKNIPIQEYLVAIKEKYFIDKNMDFLLGFWFTLRVIEQKTIGILMTAAGETEGVFIDNKDNVCLSSTMVSFFNEFISAFILFGKAVLELVIKCRVKNRKVNGIISWFLYFFFGLYSPARERITFNRLMHHDIPIDLTTIKEGCRTESIDMEMTKDEMKIIRLALSKEPSDFLKGMRYCFEFIDKFFLVLPQNMRNYILSERHLSASMFLLKKIIDEILLKRAKWRFNFADQTLVASIGMIEFLKSPYRIDFLKRDYENTISDDA